MLSSIHLGLLALGTLAAGKTIDVKVGDGGLVFSPNNVAAAVGDVVEFHFFPQDHSVVQGSFDKPCSVGSVTGGFNSGFVPSSKGEAAQVFQVTVTSTDPMYFYCSQISHCQNGMVGAINPPSSGNTVDAYSTAAGATSNSESPSSVSGGTLTTSSGSDDGGDNSSSSSKGSDDTSTTAPPSSTATSAASFASKVSSEESSKSSSESSNAPSSAAAGVTSTAGSAAPSASGSASGAGSSVASSATAKVTGNSAAGLGRVSFEMLGLAVLAGGAAGMMQ